MESTYEFYMKSKLRLATARFRLKKFATNSEELSCRIPWNDSLPFDGIADSASHCEEDQSYAKSSWRVKTDDKLRNYEVLSLQWNMDGDEFQFNFHDVITTHVGVRAH